MCVWLCTKGRVVASLKLVTAWCMRDCVQKGGMVRILDGIMLIQSISSGCLTCADACGCAAAQFYEKYYVFNDL